MYAWKMKVFSAAVAVALWLSSTSTSQAQLPPCNSKVPGEKVFCGTGADCPAPDKGLCPSNAIMVEQQGNFSPCKAGTPSQRCNEVKNFVCTKSWYCKGEQDIDPMTGLPSLFDARCVKSSSPVLGPDGKQVISTSTSGAAASCDESGS